MKRLVTASILGTVLWLSGCGNSALLMLDKDEHFKSSLDLTHKQQLKNKAGETLGLFRATYLNPIYPDEYSDLQYFFVGIHLQDDLAAPQAGIHNPHYRLSMNDLNVSRIEDVSENDPLYKRMPLVERWTHYYVVAFDDNASAKLGLLYKKDTNESLKFSFPRYIKPE